MEHGCVCACAVRVYCRPTQQIEATYQMGLIAQKVLDYFGDRVRVSARQSTASHAMLRPC